MGAFFLWINLYLQGPTSTIRDIMDKRRTMAIMGIMKEA